jgi:hypothetical protein
MKINITPGRPMPRLLNCSSGPFKLGVPPTSVRIGYQGIFGIFAPDGTETATMGP